MEGEEILLSKGANGYSTTTSLTGEIHAEVAVFKKLPASCPSTLLGQLQSRVSPNRLFKGFIESTPIFLSRELKLSKEGGEPLEEREGVSKKEMGEPKRKEGSTVRWGG